MEGYKAITDFINYIISKLNTLENYEEDKIVIDFETDFLSKSDSYFPRLNVMPTSFDDVVRVEQRKLEMNLTFIIIGYHRKPKEATHIECAMFLMEELLKIRGKVFSILTDKRKGIEIAKGFQELYPQTNCELEVQFDERLSSFYLEFGAKFILTDEVC